MIKMNHERKNHIIPTIESDAFVDRQDFRFALGKIAVNGVIINGYENEFMGAAQLRANTYLDSGFINSNDLDNNGTELDQNDYSRSAHFVILERTAVSSLARVVGNMRLIVKSDESSSNLPVENYCPDKFASEPIAIGGVEVSRLIARHEDVEIQNLLKWPLFIAGHKYVEQNNLGPVYGLLSTALTRLLRSQRIPVSAIAESRYIKEINTEKQPVIINVPLLKRLIKSTGDQGIDVTRTEFSYIDVEPSLLLKKDIHENR